MNFDLKSNIHANLFNISYLLIIFFGAFLPGSGTKKIGSEGKKGKMDSEKRLLGPTTEKKGSFCFFGNSCKCALRMGLDPNERFLH